MLNKKKKSPEWYPFYYLLNAVADYIWTSKYQHDLNFPQNKQEEDILHVSIYK